MRASYVCHLTNDSAEDERCQIKTGLVRKEGLSICAGAFFSLMEASMIAILISLVAYPFIGV